MEDYLDSLEEAKSFSTLDANAVYRQIAIDEQDCVKTACTSRYGLFQSLRLPFGLKKEPRDIPTGGWRHAVIC